MPSPFPGMDPFLESHYFPTFRTGMIVLMQESLQNHLPEGYFAATDEQVWIDTEALDGAGRQGKAFSARRSAPSVISNFTKRWPTRADWYAASRS